VDTPARGGRSDRSGPGSAPDAGALAVPAVRAEAPGDRVAVRHVDEEAFGRPDEAQLVDLLRERGGALLSLVAVVRGRVVGHVLFTPVRLESPDRALDGAGLGPMAVLPAFQRAGVGSRLATDGIARLRADGCPFVVVLGHPEYYPRFGFVPASRHGVRCPWPVPDDAFMLLALDPARVQGASGVARYRDEFVAVK